MISLVMMATVIALTQVPQEVPQPSPPEKSLDDLLGIAQSDTDAAAAEGARAQRETLARSLSAGEAQSTLESAINSMKRSATLLREQELGLSVQRLQEDVLARLDALIDSAQQQQQRRQGASSSASGRSGQQENQPGAQKKPGGSGSDAEEAKRRQAANDRARGAQGAQDGSPQAGTGNNPGEAPPVEATIEGGILEETEAEWGSLPPRTREILRQGTRERMSSVYRKMTEAYYRRIAQEAKK